MIENDIKQITDVKELQRLYIELNNESEKQEKEIERLNKQVNKLNNILDTLMQDMALLNATGKKEIKPKYVFDRIAILRGVDKE